MILKKVVINNEIYYKEITQEEASKLPNKKYLLFTDNTEKDTFYENLYNDQQKDFEKRVKEINKQINELARMQTRSYTNEINQMERKAYELEKRADKIEKQNKESERKRKSLFLIAANEIIKNKRNKK